METTAGTLLGGLVVYSQPRSGFRSGIEPVLLAASVPARGGQSVLEGGTGAGAGLLCLARRVAGVVGLGVERDPALAALANSNVAANGLHGITVSAADLLHHSPIPPVDHAFANPPWHARNSTASADARREAAKRGYPGLIAAWAASLGRPLRDRGTLTFIVSAAATAEALAAVAAVGCGTIGLLPLWPLAERAAGLVLVQGTKGGRAGTRVLPGLILHDGVGGYTPAADSILRAGAALAF